MPCAAPRSAPLPTVSCRAPGWRETRRSPGGWRCRSSARDVPAWGCRCRSAADSAPGQVRYSSICEKLSASGASGAGTALAERRPAEARADAASTPSSSDCGVSAPRRRVDRFRDEHRRPAPAAAVRPEFVRGQDHLVTRPRQRDVEEPPLLRERAPIVRQCPRPAHPAGPATDGRERDGKLPSTRPQMKRVENSRPLAR